MVTQLAALPEGELISIVILTYNRPDSLSKSLNYIGKIKHRPLEVIVVDNHSDIPVDAIVDQYEFARVIRTEANLGVGGRNRGLAEVRGNIVITLDDDVYGVTDEALIILWNLFIDTEIGAVCFKVTDEVTDEVINWCHHYRQDEYSDHQFMTNEITEGAVAFRVSALRQSGYYPERFFISHEGPDLAFRLMNVGYKVLYTPSIVVKHSHAIAGRPNWRRYYYDTRNLLWLALRNYPFWYGVKRLSIGLGAMFVYALRDGFLRYWFKGVFDALRAAPEVLGERTGMTAHTIMLNRQIESFRPSFWYMLKKRLFSKKVRI